MGTLLCDHDLSEALGMLTVLDSLTTGYELCIQLFLLLESVKRRGQGFMRSTGASAMWLHCSRSLKRVSYWI